MKCDAVLCLGRLWSREVAFQAENSQHTFKITVVNIIVIITILFHDLNIKKLLGTNPCLPPTMNVAFAGVMALLTRRRQRRILLLCITLFIASNELSTI